MTARFHTRNYTTLTDAILRLDGREAIQNLMAEVESGHANFSAILVYDVSRWGRFQDADEGAYHEHICSRAGIRVHYCGEQFENDGSIGSNLLKTVKRVMAGEYSRELSVKVFAGQCRLVELGFRQGGTPGYGLRRVLIDEQGNHKGELGRGDRKKPSDRPCRAGRRPRAAIKVDHHLAFIEISAAVIVFLTAARATPLRRRPPGYFR